MTETSQTSQRMSPVARVALNSAPFSWSCLRTLSALTFLACRLPIRWCSSTAREGKGRWQTSQLTRWWRAVLGMGLLLLLLSVDRLLSLVAVLGVALE